MHGRETSIAEPLQQPSESPRLLEDPGPTRRRIYLVVAPLMVLLILWVWFFHAEGAIKGGPNGKAFEADFAMFVSAAALLQHGGNAFDNTKVYESERSFLHSQGLPITAKRGIVRVGNPPLFFWSLQPFVGMQFQPAAWFWGIFLYLLSAVGFLILLTHLGWKHRVVPLLIFLFFPPVLFGPFYGNAVVLVFIAVCIAIPLLNTRPYVAGAVLTMAWMKPPIALPFVLLLVLFQTSERKKVCAGFAATTGIMLALTSILVGPASLSQWIAGLVKYSHDLALSPDIASLAGLYVRSTSHGLRLALQTCTILLALTLTMAVWLRAPKPRTFPVIAVGWLWVFWFLATPYAHFYDEIMLTFPILAFLGRDAAYVTMRNQAITLYLLFFSLLVIQAAPAGIQLLSLPLIAVNLCLVIASRGLRPALHVSREVA